MYPYMYIHAYVTQETCLCVVNLTRRRGGGRGLAGGGRELQRGTGQRSQAGRMWVRERE